MRHPFLTTLLLGFSVCLWAQNGTLKRGSNLRKGPSTSTQILENLHTGDSVSLISSSKRAGYYHVRSADGTSGWLWARNLSIGAAPAAPSTNHALALTVPSGLLAQLAAATVAAVPKPLIINGQTVCGAKGNATHANMQALDSEKNRTDIPNSYIPLTWDQIKNLPAANHSRYEGSPVAVVGFLSSQVKQETSGTGESTNCNLHQPDEVDWHIYLTKQPNQPIKNAVIVETTPRTRPLHQWVKADLDNLVNTTTKVRISGWLMYDFQHVGEIGVHRASVWEVHPITKIEVTGANGSWKDIEH